MSDCFCCVSVSWIDHSEILLLVTVMCIIFMRLVMHVCICLMPIIATLKCNNNRFNL